MKMVKVISLSLITMVLAACGQSQPATTAYNAALYTNGWTSTGGGSTCPQPIYSGSTQTGCKTHYVISSGTTYTIPGTAFSQSFPINQGDKVYLNFSDAYYEVGSIGVCSGTFNTPSYTPSWASISGMTASYNGVNKTGVFSATTSGNLMVNATLASVSVSCWPSGHAPVYSYYVSLSTGYDSVVELDHCVDMNGNPMTCP